MSKRKKAKIEEPKEAKKPRVNYDELRDALGFQPPTILEDDLKKTNRLFSELFPSIPDWATVDGDEPQTFESFFNMERWKMY